MFFSLKSWFCVCGGGLLVLHVGSLCLYMYRSKSRAVQHLTMIFIRAWYLEMPQQPAPAGVLEDLREGGVGDEPSDGLEYMPDDSQNPEEDQ